MKQSKKYDCRVIQDNDGWTAEITRRVTSRVTVVSKGKGGFATEAEAQAWGQGEVKDFLKKTNLGEQEKRRARKIEDEKKSSIKVKKQAEQKEEQKEEQEEKDDD